MCTARGRFTQCEDLRTNSMPTFLSASFVPLTTMAQLNRSCGTGHQGRRSACSLIPQTHFSTLQSQVLCFQRTGRRGLPLVRHPGRDTEQSRHVPRLLLQWCVCLCPVPTSSLASPQLQKHQTRKERILQWAVWHWAFTSLHFRMQCIWGIAVFQDPPIIHNLFLLHPQPSHAL